MPVITAKFLDLARSDGLAGTLASLYTSRYQIPPFCTSSNADAQVWGVMAVLTLALILLPFIPGLRRYRDSFRVRAHLARLLPKPERIRLKLSPPSAKW